MDFPDDSHDARCVQRLLKGILCGVAAAALYGCSTAPSYPPAPLVVDVPNRNYRIGPLDTLNIVVWRNPDLSSTVTVRPDGYISAPLVEDTMAAGRNPADLARDLQQSLAKYI